MSSQCQARLCLLYLNQGCCVLWCRLRAKLCLRRCSCLRQGRRSRIATEGRPRGSSWGQAELLGRYGVSTWLSSKQSQTLVVTWHHLGSWWQIRRITDMGELSLCRGAHKVYCFGCMCVNGDICLCVYSWTKGSFIIIIIYWHYNTVNYEVIELH